LARKLGKHRLSLIIVGLAIVIGASLPPFMTASCLTRQQTAAELRALESLRAMTHGGVLPADDVVARMESSFPRTKAAALARLVRARIKLNAKDYSGAASLLDSKVIRDFSNLGDYALFMRAEALKESNQLPQARAIYQELVQTYPSSIRAREAYLQVADLLMRDGHAAAVPLLLKDLAAKDDPAALLWTGRAAERMSDSTRALASYRRLYFFAPASDEAGDAAQAIVKLGSTTSPATEEEARQRAVRLYDSRKFADAVQAYGDAFAKYPNTANSENQLRRGIAAYNSRKTPEAISSLNAVPTSAGEQRAEALFYLAQTYARGRQWEQVRSSLDELRRAFPRSSFTPRAFVAAGNIATDAKNSTDGSYFLRTAVTSYPDSLEVAQAQFDLAWQAHDAKDFQTSSRMLTEHLAQYADKNTDNRGRAGYWAARDSERAGKLAEARALYEAVLGRYDANWYGYLAKQRLDLLSRTTPKKTFEADSIVSRAIANLQTVTVAEESVGTEGDLPIIKADQLTNIGLDDWALKELTALSDASPDSPRVNLAIAAVYRAQEDNVRGLNVLKRSFPDYSQMKPEEMTREQWDVFYPLSYWEIIVQESRARSLDPYQVAGLIRQETVFNPRAHSPANAYGLMQLLVPTGRLTAKKYGVERTVTVDSLYEPRLNIQLGSAYLRDQMDKFGRIEYVAAAYNAGPLRVPQWRASLPAEIDEWVENIPFKETRGYVQGVVRNRLQYMRLYDENGRFRSEVGKSAVVRPPSVGPSPSPEPVNPNVRKRRISGTESEE
jgi:soluble lytic murein transglycosylase